MRQSYCDVIRERTIEEAKNFIREKTTIREVAKKMGISKSTIHKDLTERLPEFSKELAEQVREILDLYLQERHIRGGESTRQIYLDKKKH